MHTLTVAQPELETLLTALRYLQENLASLPREFAALNDGQAPTEAEIDDLCGRLTETAYHRAA
ncbi:hypothetical protein [Salinarimonas soli]|uniref:Uncharacterized protein n=1 Tax=Salinarimonas soli TaxID=1638099 RepID=A0A5B2V8W1_9HYPH|nr:hypothetical protein [Salinarimonas soli]KAA2235933.1 hypothetical protein F0L46_17365 [Salinarimonas soli]